VNVTARNNNKRNQRQSVTTAMYRNEQWKVNVNQQQQIDINNNREQRNNNAQQQQRNNNNGTW
jgi:hypothetical protein